MQQEDVRKVVFTAISPEGTKKVKITFKPEAAEMGGGVFCLLALWMASAIDLPLEEGEAFMEVSASHDWKDTSRQIVATFENVFGAEEMLDAFCEMANDIESIEAVA